MNGLLDIARARTQLAGPRGTLLQFLNTWLPIGMEAGQSITESSVIFLFLSALATVITLNVEAGG